VVKIVICGDNCAILGYLTHKFADFLQKIWLSEHIFVFFAQYIEHKIHLKFQTKAFFLARVGVV